jgi:thiamine pyrophosphate-dependent acetolactate synthase large subunit-like protein
MKTSRTIHSFLLSQQEGQTLLTAQEYPWSVLQVIPTTPADFDRTVAALKERGMVAHHDTDRTVCVFMGDGGLQMNLQELGTIMEQKAPVKMILLNNNFLGNVRQWQAMFFNRRYSFTPMMNPDYMKIASAYDIPARRVMTREELAKAIDEMIATDGPFLLEACVEEEGNVMPMTPPGGSVNQMLLECLC